MLPHQPQPLKSVMSHPLPHFAQTLLLLRMMSKNPTPLPTSHPRPLLLLLLRGRGSRVRHEPVIGQGRVIEGGVHGLVGCGCLRLLLLLLLLLLVFGLEWGERFLA